MSGTQSITFRPQTPTVTLSQLTETFKNAGSDQHLRFSKEKGLHTHARYDASPVDFKAFFGNSKALSDRADLRSNATAQVRQAIDNQYGKGMADRVFAKADETGNNFASGITKRDLDNIAYVVDKMSIEDSNNAKDLLGGQSLFSVFSSVVGDIPNKVEAFGKLEAQMGNAVQVASEKGVMVPDDTDPEGKKMKRIDATPEQLKRVAIGVVIKHEIVDVLRESMPKRQQELNKASNPPLSPKEAEQKMAGARPNAASIKDLEATIDTFTAPDGAMADIDITLVRTIALDLAKFGNQSLVTSESITKVYERDSLQKLPTDAKLEKIANYVEFLLHPDKPLSEGDVTSFARTSGKKRNEPGYAELLMLRTEVNGNFKESIDKIESRLGSMKTFEVHGENLAPLTSAQSTLSQTPNNPPRPQVLDPQTNKMRDKTDEEMTETDKSDYQKVMQQHADKVKKANELKSQLQLEQINKTPDALSVPLASLKFFDEMLGELIGGYTDEKIQEKVNSLPESFCQMFAVAHKTIDEKATFTFTPRQLESKSEEDLIKDSKADLKKKIDINFMALRVISPMIADRSNNNPGLQNKLSSFAGVLQGVMNGISPLNKGLAHHEQVVKYVGEHMKTWQSAVEKFGQKIAERGRQLNELAQL